jgi:hypothetical protein
MESKKPSVKYHTIVYVDQNGNIETNNNHKKLMVNNVIKVINGTLESVLHLIGYSYMQIRKLNRELSIRYDTEQNREFVLSLFESQINDDLKKSRPVRTHIVLYDNRLYGVIIDKGIARICGHINRVISCPKDDNNNVPHMRGIRIDRTNNENNWFSCDTEVRNLIENGKHIIEVSEKGALFIVSNGERIGHQFDDQLLLIIGHGFAVIDDSPQIPVHWIRTKQNLKEYQRESTQLTSGESIVVAFAAISISCDHYKVYGTGSVINIKTIKQFSDPI